MIVMIDKRLPIDGNWSEVAKARSLDSRPADTLLTVEAIDGDVLLHKLRALGWRDQGIDESPWRDLWRHPNRTEIVDGYTAAELERLLAHRCAGTDSAG